MPKVEYLPEVSLDGRVTLYRRDCMKILPFLKDNSVDIIVTDPPFGHNNNNNGDLIHRWEAALGRGPHGEARPIANDGVEANELLKEVLPHFRRILKPGACLCCCCGGGGPDPQFARWSLWIDEFLDFKQMIVWDKGPMGMGWHYRRSYETILVATKLGAACKWYDKTNAVENIIRPGHPTIFKIIPSKHEHPNKKPRGLAEHFINLHSKEDDLVFDPFAGEGWSADAAIRLGRRFVGMEIDPEFFSGLSMRVGQCVEHQRRMGKWKWGNEMMNGKSKR